MTRRSILILTLGIAAALQMSGRTAAVAAQTGQATLKVAGDVATPLTLTAAEIRAMPRTRAEVKEGDRTLVYEGVLVAELLKRAGVPLGADLRGNALASYVVASAADGYQVVFSLAELDPALTGNGVIVADALDGKPLLENQGPFRIVTPKDARPARSVRMLATLNVVRLIK